jgi:Cof subfamily protein (haloacid dehalogenase superfamily)
MQMLIAPLGLTTPIAGFNGGVLVSPDLEVIESHQLEGESARRAVAIMREDGLDPWLYTADEWQIRDALAPHVAREAWTVKFDARVVEEFAPADLDRAVKVTGCSDDLERVAACEARMQAELGVRASAARSQPYYLDVTSAKANKGEVVRTLAARLRVAPSEIATLGDQPNDTLMFAVSGFAIAMGNASDQVKAKASAVTDSNEDEGFAKAVERFILPRAPKNGAAT